MAARKRKKVSELKNFEGTKGTEGTATADATFSGSLEKITEGTEGTAGGDLAAALEAGAFDPVNDSTGASESNEVKFPPPDKRPCFKVYEDWCGPEGKCPPGVWYHGIKAGKEDAPPQLFDSRVCSPLHIEAVTCTDSGHHFGRLLRFRDTFGRWREWAMPMELLGGSCEELRRELLASGVEIDHQNRAKLADYLQWRTPKRRIVAAIHTGWTADGKAFVLPDRVIGSEDVIFQAETVHQEGAAGTGGDFETWKRDIAALCAGNPVLELSVCVPLSGPLLAKVHRDSGGIHWVGDSSTGKTTGLNVGCSVWGGETFRRTWRATSNGLEGAAASLNDTCLCLDEINEADPREIGSIVYALGNGTGKTRANRTGAARNAFRWRLSLLSTGERTLAAQMAEGGKQPKAGQLVRLLNVPAARAHGVFDELHGFPDGRALADHLKTATGRHYGHAGPAFVEAMIKDGRDFGAALAEVEAMPLFRADDGQEARAASRFALYGMAGELAVEWGILPWPEGEALQAAATLYAVWKAARGKGTTEDRQILQAVTDFIAKHGDGRFSRKGDGERTGDGIFRDRAGWWTATASGDRVYLFTPAGLREATAGHDFSRALTALDSADWIVDRDHGKRSKKTAIEPGRKLALYWIQPGEMDE
jgi:putative DNA primase/helicase